MLLAVDGTNMVVRVYHALLFNAKRRFEAELLEYQRRVAVDPASAGSEPAPPTVELEHLGRAFATTLRAAVRDLKADHLVIAFDHETPTFRKQLADSYKAGRDFDTKPLVAAARDVAAAIGATALTVPGFEADDLLATLARRVAGRMAVGILSADKDLQACVTDRVTVYTPGTAGVRFEEWTPARVCEKYRIASPVLLSDLKALMGEEGDGVAGVPGIGPGKGADLLAAHGSFEGVIAAARALDRDGKTPLHKVQAHLSTAELAIQLVRLREDVPLPPITPSTCRVLGLQWDRIGEPAAQIQESIEPSAPTAGTRSVAHARQTA
jgi:5'-3' exonuclease